MKSFKRVDGDYTIQLVNDTDVLTLESNTVAVNGNLEVTGNITYIDTEQLLVTDPFLLVNKSSNGSYSSNAGMLMHKTSSTYAGIRYNVNDDKWELSTNTDETGEVGTWNEITVGTNVSPGGVDSAIQFNDGNTFAGSDKFLFDSTESFLVLNGKLALYNQLDVPNPSPGFHTMYANSTSTAGTGIYVVTDDGTNEELVSKSKAIVFGIIF